MACSNRTAAQGSPCTDEETEVQGGRITLSGPPSEGEVPGTHHGPRPRPVWFCARGTLVPTEGGMGAPRQCAASLGLAASGVSRAWAWACVLCWPGRAGGGPIRAPSQNLPLSLVTAASLLCLAQVQPPHASRLRAVALPSRFSRLGALVGGASLNLSFLI